MVKYLEIRIYGTSMFNSTNAAMHHHAKQSVFKKYLKVHQQVGKLVGNFQIPKVQDEDKKKSERCAGYCILDRN